MDKLIDKNSKNFSLKEDVEEIIKLISDINPENLTDKEKDDYKQLIKFKKLLETNFFDNTRQVYEYMYNTVDLLGNKHVRALATEKATVAAFAAAYGYAHPRFVTVKREGKSLGFNITGGREQECSIFVSKIIPNSVADVPDGLRRGDQIISINGVNVENETHSKVVKIFKSEESTFSIVVRHLPHILNEIEKNLDD